MAQRVTGVGQEVLRTGAAATNVRVTGIGQEVLRTGPAATNARVTDVFVEVLHSIGTKVSAFGVEVLRALTLAPPSGQPSFLLTATGQQMLADNRGQFGSWTTAGSTTSLASEAENQHTGMLRAGGIFSNMMANVTQNNGGVTSTLTFRKNGVSGYMALSVPAAATGWFEDVQDTDTAVAGDEVGFKALFPSGSGTVTFQSAMVRFVPDSQRTITYGVSYYDSDGYFGASTTTYYAPMFDPRGGALATGGSGFDTFEGRVGRATGTLANYRVQIGTNPSTVALTLDLMTSAATVATGLTVSVPIGASGFFEDITHTYTLSAETGLVTRITGLTMTSGLFRLLGQQVAFTSNDARHDFTSYIRSGSTSVATMYFELWNNGPQTTEALAQVRAPFDLRWSNIRYYTIFAAGVGTYKSRVNGADGHQAVSLLGSGWFEDVTGVDFVAKGDLFDTQVSGNNSGRVSYAWGSTVRESPRVDDTTVMIIGD
jgi:hypothetical protein